MDNFLEDLKLRLHTLTPDQLVYMFVPELICMKKEAQENFNVIRVAEINQVLVAIKEKLDLDSFSVTELSFTHPKFKVPKPGDIINGISPKDIPNN